MSNLSDDDWRTNPRHKTNVTRKAERKRDLFGEWINRDDDVLHIGCGGGFAGRPGESGWFHADLDDMIDGVLVGIDTDREAVESARENGYDVRHGDATALNLPERFDVVAAPNIIEHVDNPGQMLECVQTHLRPEGKLLLTTDRMLIPWWLLQMLKDGESPGVHPEHTMHFCKEHLDALLNRTDFHPVAYQPWGFKRLGLTPADRAWRAVERLLTHVPGLHDIDKVQHFMVAEPTGLDGSE